MLQAQVASANKSSQSFSKGIPGLSRWGNQLQWAGRQLQYNFTLPIAIAGGAAVKFALDNERAAVRIKKVYGDAGHDAVFYSKEIEALGRNFEQLSNRFGVNQSAVLDVAAAWAAAGSSGAALARATKLTLETMVLGELDATQATEALIAIQAQFNFSTKELSKTIDTLNMIENQTGISMGGLIQGFQRSAGVARTAGIDVQHLGAMLAALVPSSGSAANAGNALKTIISRLLSPTKEASEVMQLMGVHVKETAWQSLNGTQRLEAMSKAYAKLNGTQKVVVASTIASRWQINRFDVLMKDLINDQGYYNKALRSTQDANANFIQKQKELNYVLDSSPQRLKQIWVILQNAMADIIQPLIPIILRLGTAIAKLGQWFQGLSPQVQATVLGFAVFLAAIGPVARYIGSVANLFGLLTEAVHFFGRGIVKVGGLFNKMFLAPFKLMGTVASSAASGVASVATSIGGSLAKGLAAVGPLLRTAIITPLATMGRAMLVAMTPGLVAVRVAVMQTLRQIGGAIAVSTGMMVRSMITIWGSMMSQLAGLVAAGVGRVTALWFAMGIRMTASSALMATNIPRLFSAMYIGILAGGRRLMAALPLLFTGMMSGIRVVLVAMTAGIARWGAGLVVLLRSMVPIIMRAMLSPWGIAIAAVVGLLYHFRDNLGGIFNDVVVWVQNSSSAIPKAFSPVVTFFNRAVGWITDAFWKLPAGVRDALLTVIKIVQIAAQKVYELFSYLNPFARHSPSLVESVTAGMAEIKRQYASVGNVGAIFQQAARDLASYKTLANSLQTLQWKDTAADIGKGLPGYLPLFNSLLGDLKSLNNTLAAQSRAVAGQQAVVDKWAAAVDRANAALDREQAALDLAKDKLSDLNDAYSEHKAALEDFASAPLQGMQEMNDAIFANELAQKKLQLQMMDWEKVNGSIDDVRNRLAAMQGDIETMRGQASDLRSAGAGSDILGPIEAQVTAMEQQRAALEKSVQDSPITQMEDQLKQLQDAAQRLSLEKDIKFDPMVHEIEKLASAQKELTYDQIVDGIKSEKAAMAALQPQIDAATAAVNQHEAALKKAQATRDAASAQYDVENTKLQALKDQYDSTEDAIRDIEAALRDMGTAAQDNIAKAERAAQDAKNALKNGKGGFGTPGAQNFMAAQGAADFPEVGGGAKIGREGGVADQAGEIDKLTADIAKEVNDAFGKFDMFGPLKVWWNKAWAWVETNIGNKVQPVLDKIVGWVSKIPNPFKNFTVADNVKTAFDTVGQIISDVRDAIKRVFQLFAPDIQRTIAAIVSAAKKIWNEVGPELEKFGKPLSKAGDAFKNLWMLVKPLIAILGIGLLGAVKIVASVFSNVLGPVLGFVIDIIRSVVKVIRGMVEVVVGLLTGDWAMAWQGVKDILAGTWDAIFAIFEGAVKIIVGVVKGIVQGVVGWFQWLWDILVGHSIVPDMINAIIAWFASLPKKVIDAVISLVMKFVDVAHKMWDQFTEASGKKWATFIGWIKTLPQNTWDNFIKLKDKIVDVAAKAWDAFWAREKSGWSNIIKWVASLPQDTWNNLIKLRDKITDVAAKAWDSFWSRGRTGWSSFIGWIRTLPQNSYDNIIAIRDKLSAAAKAGFDALVSKAKAIVDGRGGLMEWVRGIPGRIASALGGIGGAVAGGVKNSWNGAARWLNDNAMGAMNKVTSKFGFNMPRLPYFAGGGIIPGRISKRDNTLIAARSGEGVIVPELVKALGGARGLALANNAAKQGRIDQLREMGIQGFAGGGIIGKVTGWIQSGAGNALGKIFDAGADGVRAVLPGRSFFEDYSAGNLHNAGNEARKWGDKQEAAGNGVLPGIGWRWQVAALKKKFPGIIITSTTRPGAITVSGNQSYHALGRAVDMAPDMKYFNWIKSTYGKNTKELIYSPAGGKQLKNGQEYMYTGAVRDQHFNHVHWAYDRGGLLPPGFTLARNGTGNDELVLTKPDMIALLNAVASMDRMMSKSGSGATPGAATVARMTGAVSSLQAKLNAQARSQSDVVRGGDTIGTQLNFYGDLSFPNVTNGDDAEDFLKHLKGL